MIAMAEMLEATPYAGYTYSYPHKTSHRPFDKPVPLEQLWASERREALFLYLHVPFCEHRCGYCNLFSAASPPSHLVEEYVSAIKRQAPRVRDALGEAQFARLALGGGTPTFLGEADLQSLLDVAAHIINAPLEKIPVSVEASPSTVTAAKLSLLQDYHVDRVSIGVQSFDEHEARAIGRVQRRDEVERSLDAIQQAGFATLNIDLIYGGPRQTIASWLSSVRQATRYSPQELYLYPLYVRPGTGLGREAGQWEDERLTAYREARAILLDEGYEQISMRMFRAKDAMQTDAPVYRCQEDGMIGLGCGARSYTRSLHYSTRYAVDQPAVRSILQEFVGRSTESFGFADHGFRLDGEDQRRRYVIISLLLCEGLSRPGYAKRFGRDPLDDLSELAELQRNGLATFSADRIRLNEAGVERSDNIGPWLYSAKVRRLMESYKLC